MDADVQEGTQSQGRFSQGLCLLLVLLELGVGIFIFWTVMLMLTERA